MARRWSSKSAASAFAHGIFYFFIRSGGRRVAYFFLHFVVAWYTLFTADGRRGKFYLARRFPDSGWLSQLRHRWSLNLAFGKVLVDRATLGITGETGMANAASVADQLHGLLGARRGVLILSAHVGCWQMAMSALESVRAKKHVVYRRPPDDVDKLAHEHGNFTTSVSYIDPGGPFGGVTEITAALQQNAVVCMTGDRLFGSARAAVSVDFLNGAVSVPATAYRIAAALGTPLVVMFFPRTGAGKFGGEIMDIISVPDRGRDLLNYRPEARRFAAALEKFCASHPHQFFNFFDLWE